MRLASSILASSILASLLVLSLAGRASASPYPKTSAPTRKAPSTAVAISLGATAVSLAVAGAGVRSSEGHLGGLGPLVLIVAPSAGQWYSGRIGVLGMVARTVAVVGVMTAIDMAEADIGPCTGGCADELASYDRRQRTAKALAIGAATLWLGATVYDHIGAARAATRWNREHGLIVAPAMVSTGGARAPGVAMSLRF